MLLQKTIISVFVFSLGFLLGGTVFASGKKPVPLGRLYPGDEGIERDGRVLFVEDFEAGGVDEIGARWGQISKKANFSLSGDVHGKSAGKRSIRIAKNGHLFTHPKGVDTMYARFYVKFHEKTGYIHHFVHLVADSDPKPWPKAGAGNLWKSVNNGTTWEPIFENESTFAIGDVSIAPADSNIVWVGTGEVLLCLISRASQRTGRKKNDAVRREASITKECACR